MIHPLRHVDEESSIIGITVDPRVDPGTQRGRRVGEKLSIPHEKVVTPDGARQPGDALRRAALGRIFRDFEPAWVGNRVPMQIVVDGGACRRELPVDHCARRKA